MQRTNAKTIVKLLIQSRQRRRQKRRLFYFFFKKKEKSERTKTIHVKMWPLDTKHRALSQAASLVAASLPAQSEPGSALTRWRCDPTSQLARASPGYASTTAWYIHDNYAEQQRLFEKCNFSFQKTQINHHPKQLPGTFINGARPGWSPTTITISPTTNTSRPSQNAKHFEHKIDESDTFVTNGNTRCDHTSDFGQQNVGEKYIDIDIERRDKRKRYDSPASDASQLHIDPFDRILRSSQGAWHSHSTETTTLKRRK